MKKIHTFKQIKSIETNRSAEYFYLNLSTHITHLNIYEPWRAR